MSVSGCSHLTLAPFPSSIPGFKTDRASVFLRAQDRAELLPQTVTSAKTALDLAVPQYREGVTSLVGIYRALGGVWKIREGQDLVPPDW